MHISCGMFIDISMEIRVGNIWKTDAEFPFKFVMIELTKKLSNLFLGIFSLTQDQKQLCLPKHI